MHGVKVIFFRDYFKVSFSILVFNYFESQKFNFYFFGTTIDLRNASLS